jgi:hypothetical protein
MNLINGDRDAALDGRPCGRCSEGRSHVSRLRLRRFASPESHQFKRGLSSFRSDRSSAFRDCRIAVEPSRRRCHLGAGTARNGLLAPDAWGERL